MTLFLFALLIVGAALVFIYYDSHRSAAAKLQDQDNREDDQPLDIEKHRDLVLGKVAIQLFLLLVEVADIMVV